MANQYAEQEEAIAQNPVTAHRVRLAQKFLEECTFTTTCLLSLADALESIDESTGATILRKWADEFREHEATTL